MCIRDSYNHIPATLRTNGTDPGLPSCSQGLAIALKGSARMGEGHLDRDLVQRVQKGDKGAFDLLVLKYQHKIIKLIGRYVHDPSEALDVSQEAFLKAYRALPGFRGDSAFYTWLYRVAINTAKNLSLIAIYQLYPDGSKGRLGLRYDADGGLQRRPAGQHLSAPGDSP